MPGTHEERLLKTFCIALMRMILALRRANDPNKDDAGVEQLPYKTAGLMSEDDML